MHICKIKIDKYFPRSSVSILVEAGDHGSVHLGMGGL